MGFDNNFYDDQNYDESVYGFMTLNENMFGDAMRVRLLIQVQHTSLSVMAAIIPVIHIHMRMIRGAFIKCISLMITLILMVKKKPIFIKKSDGGPDLNVRTIPNIRAAITQFKEDDLDYYRHSISPPNNSAINAIERRMAPIKQLLSAKK